MSAADKVREIEDRVVGHLGFSSALRTVGQVYPRSLDFEVVSALYQLGSAPSSFAKTLRLMAGLELADAFFTIDGMLETTLVVLDQMGAYPAVVARENAHYLTFLATTTFLMEAVKSGAGREAAHEAIKEHAGATVLDLRNGAIADNDLIDRLAADDRLGLSRITPRPSAFDGAAWLARARPPAGRPGPPP